jgi:hypothetical protein
MGAVQVTVVQAVPLPDERQRLGRVQPLPPGREVGARILVVDRVIQADVDSAESLCQIVETGQIDLGEVVNGDARQVSHRAQRRGPAGLTALGLQFLLSAVALAGQLLRDILFGQPVRLFDFDVVVPRDPGERHPVVARDREGDDSVVGADVHQDHRVGVVATVVGIAGVQMLQDRVRQIVAVLIFTRIQPDQQDVHVVAAGPRIVGQQGVRHSDTAQRTVRHVITRPGEPHGRHGNERAQGARQPLAETGGLTDGSMTAMGAARAGHHKPLPTPSASPGTATVLCGDVASSMVTSMR